MIVVFTDEAGDDIAAPGRRPSMSAANTRCRCMSIGVPAPFGRVTAYVKYIDPDPKFDQSPQWAPVHQGPESLLPERLMLLFGGTPEEESQVDSGFGPFGLCRLAYETGGLYFTVHPNRKLGQRIQQWETASMSSHISMFFDPRVMRNYRPDYVSAAEYHKLLQSNRACAALVEAAQMSAITPMEDVRLRFPKVDDAQFARDLSNAQRTAAKLEPRSQPARRHPAARRKGPAEDHDAALAGRLRPGDGPGAGGPGADRRLQRDAGRGQAGPQIQGRKERYLGAAAIRFRGRQQRAGQERSRRQDVSGTRRGRARRYALGPGCRARAAAAARLGMARSDSPTWPAGWPSGYQQQPAAARKASTAAQTTPRSAGTL